MRKIIYSSAIAFILSAGVLTSCESDTQKVDDAKKEVEEAKEELKDAKSELNAEYPAFKTEAELKIAANENALRS